MTIRTFLTGDETAQVGIYNEAAAELPKFKPASLDEVRRRLRGADFDASLRFFALEGNRPVAYITCQRNGRISFPWCRRGHENQSEPLFEQALTTLRHLGIKRAFSAYRTDWTPQRDFLEKQGFRQVREVINFVMDLAEMPTPAARPSTIFTSLDNNDLPALLALGSKVFRIHQPAELGRWYLQNPYFSADSVFVLRSRTDNSPIAMGLVIANPSYADPKQVDSLMPCFRLGTIGAEGLTAKRINGLFSFVAQADRDVSPLGLDLLGHATRKLESTEVETIAAQVPSDAAHLVRFYKQYFRRQGSFPVFEREL